MVIVSSGCARHYRVDPIFSTERGVDESLTENGQLPWRVQSEGIPFQDISVINPYSFQPPGWDKPLYQVAVGDSTDARRSFARNELQDAIMRVSDETTAYHIAGMRATEANINLLFGAAGIGLTGGAAVAGEAAAKSFAAAATGVQGARSLVNEQVYRNALTESVIRLILADRAVTREQIRNKQRRSIVAYGVEAAIADANVYHLKGSFYHGLVLVRAAAEEKAEKKAQSAEDPAAIQLTTSSETVELLAAEQRLGLQIDVLEDALKLQRKQMDDAGTGQVQMLNTAIENRTSELEELKRKAHDVRLKRLQAQSADLERIAEAARNEADAKEEELKAALGEQGQGGGS